MLKKNDEILTLKPLWHLGSNVGDRLGKVLSVDSYILVEIYQYNNNPVKCFQYELKKVENIQMPLFDDEDTEEFLF